MEEDKKITLLMDTTRGFSSEAEQQFARWISQNPEEAMNWFKSLSQTKPEQPKKNKLLPRLKARPKPTMYNFPSVQIKTDNKI